MTREPLAGVDAERRAGVAIDELEAEAAAWHRGNRRPRALSARDALFIIEFEALFVSVAALNLANGCELSDEDRERLLIAHQRIDAIVSEATR